MSWREITLGSAIHVKHGYAFKGEFFADHGEYIVLTPGNFNEEGGFRIRPEKDRAYAGDIPETYVLDEDDLIVAMTEQGAGLLGSAALVPQANRYLHNQRLGLVDQIDSSVLDKRFLYLLFNTRSVRAQISGSASGTKVRHTAPERIYRVRTSVPDVSTQAEIAETVFAYDDLIENNRRRMTLLEESARLLYRDWFVRLRFPGHEHTRIIDGVPEGWERLPFSQLGGFVNGYPFKPAELGIVGLPIVKIPELRDGVSDKTPRNEGEDIPKKYLLNDGDLLFSWSGTLLVEFWYDGPAILNQHLFRVEPQSRYSRAFLLFALREALPEFSNQTVGATMKHIRKAALTTVTVRIPSHSLLVQFDELATDVFEQVLNLHRQNQKLRAARDLLLPRLMSGEVAV
jgi:type I restriction enzyme S subunit